MLTIIAIMFIGIAAGYLLRDKSTKWLSPALTVLIWLLLFFLGVEVGANEHVLNGIKDLGLEALLLAVAGTAGSIALAWALWRYISNRKGGGQ